MTPRARLNDIETAAPAAAMAHAGWDVISQGAELADQVIDLVQVLMEQMVFHFFD